MSRPVVLIVDDEAGIRESLAGILQDEGYETLEADSAESAMGLIPGEQPSLVLLDIWLPGMDGLDALPEIRRLAPETPVVMISGHGSVDAAVRATRLGAFDFLEKPLSLERVVLVVGRALEMRELRLSNLRLRETMQRRWRLVGDSEPMKALRDQIALAAESSSRVLITGESGTGKELVARQLHALGARAQEAFVEVNCAAIPQELIESELFGHEKGSFTGAHEAKRGKFELAHGGTLFLDEIADMSAQTQAKLLRVLENQTFQRVGGARNITVDVRVIAATNRDIVGMIAAGEFRADLYFRLNVIPIQLPPLRDRRQDIPELAEHFLGQIAEEYGQPRKTMTRGALDALTRHDWPGNVRELKNLMERLVIMTRGGEIGQAEIPTAGMQVATAGGGADLYSIPILREARDAFEREYIIRRLREYGGNISRTAEALQMERSNLHRKIKAFEIDT